MTGDALPPEESTPALRSETGGLNMAEAVARTGRNSFKLNRKALGSPVIGERTRRVETLVF